MNPVHNAPVELPPARSFPARPPPPPPVLAPPAFCFTGLSFPPPPKTLHRERAVTGRIFQALPTQTDIITLIYKIIECKKGIRFNDYTCKNKVWISFCIIIAITNLLDFFKVFFNIKKLLLHI